jgi:ABC-type transport system substrate-binding protein
MPGKSMAPSLAESWSASPNGLVYEFVLRKGVRFHSGEPVTAEDVKFSFERYRGIAAKLLKDRVAAIETPDASHVRFRLKQPWPDFMTFYGTRLEPRGRVDGLFREQAAELDPKKREATLHRVQQLIHDKVMYLPIWQLSLLQAHGPRIAESGLGLIADYPWSAPYEELKLKAK